MRFFASLAFLLLNVPYAFAQPTPVATGEHDGFTRVVFEIGSGTPWRASRENNNVILKISDLSTGFDISGSYIRLGRERIREISASPNELRLTLGCDCDISIFRAEGRYLVVDVASPDTILATPLFDFGTEEIMIANESDLLVENVAPRAIAPTSTIAFPLVFPLTSAATTESELKRFPLNAAEQSSLDDLRIQIVEEVGSAASSGLLAAASPQLADLDQGNRLQSARANMQIMPSLPEIQSETANAFTNLRITSSLDTPDFRGEDGTNTPLSGVACPSPELTDVVAWGDGATFDGQIGQLRAALFDERDMLDPDAVAQLARRYIYLGFGLEAKRTLELITKRQQAQEYLMEMAALIDGYQYPRESMLSNYIECASSVALWATLATIELDQGAQPDVESAVRTLSGLPVHLRNILAPAFSKKMLELGDPQTAARAMRTLQRLPEALEPAAKLAGAQIDLKAGHRRTAEEALKSVITHGTENSPEALVLLVESQVSQGTVIEPQAVKLIESYSTELEGTPTGEELERAHVLALMASGLFEEAVNIMNEAGIEEKSKLHLDLIRAMTERADNFIFLNYVFRQWNTIVTALSPNDKYLVAARLLRLGFAAEAADLIDSTPDRPFREERQLLSAEIAIKLDQPFKAKAALVGIGTARANAIRGQASRMAGQTAEAHQLFSEANDATASEEVAWLDDNWRNLVREDSISFGAVSALTAPSLEPATTTTGMLRKTNSLLEDSINARATLSELLQSAQVSIASEAQD